MAHNTITDSSPRGFTCECGHEVKYPPYVFARWNEELIHTCTECGAKHTITEGIAILMTGEH